MFATAQRIVSEIRLGIVGSKRCNITTQTLEVTFTTWQHLAPSGVADSWVVEVLLKGVVIFAATTMTVSAVVEFANNFLHVAGRAGHSQRHIRVECFAHLYQLVHELIAVKWRPDGAINNLSDLFHLWS